MNYFDLYSSYPDSTIAAAWNSQVKEVDKTLCLAGPLAMVGVRACLGCGRSRDGALGGGDLSHTRQLGFFMSLGAIADRAIKELVE